MKKILCFIGGVSISTMLLAQPEFKQYPAKIFAGDHRPLSLDKYSRQYRTLFKNLSTQKVNAAGHYAVETFGCGGGCSQLAAYNLKTGRGFLLAHQFSDCFSEKYGFVANDIEYELKSRLIIATGRRSEQPTQCEKVYYVLDGDDFKEIQKQWIYQK